MKKIEAATLEGAYSRAAQLFECSVTELEIVVVQHPKKGFLGLLSQTAVIVAKPKEGRNAVPKADAVPTEAEASVHEAQGTAAYFPEAEEAEEAAADETCGTQNDDELERIAAEVKTKINELFGSLCFSLDVIDVRPYDDATLLVEFNGRDAALLIGKEGYRYKALSYMLFNWINTEYQLQLRLEIAEFLKNQEESIARYLTGVFESIDRDGRAQTRILDGVLVQIALKQLRDRYHDKYVAIRSTRDGGKYIIINDYHTY